MSARDAAVDELVRTLHIEPGDAAAIVDKLTTCAAVEAGARVAEVLVEPVGAALRKHADDVSTLLGKAHRDLLGEVPPQE